MTPVFKFKLFSELQLQLIMLGMCFWDPVSISIKSSV